jgi:hypothetical protein
MVSEPKGGRYVRDLRLMRLVCDLEIFHFREGAWDPINSRTHQVQKVYLSESNERDVVVLGTVVFRHKDGRNLTQAFAGNFVFDQDAPLIQRYDAWLVRRPRSLV